MRRSLWLAAGLAVAAVAAVAQQAIIKPAQVNGGVYLASPPTLSDQQTEAFLFDVNGNLKVVSSGGSGGTSSSFGAAFPATGTAIGVKSGANMVNLTADGSNNLDVAVATSVLPTGAATSALQTTGNTTLTTINTTLGSPFQAGGALAANQSVNLSQVNGHTTVEAGANGVLAVGGQTATNVAITEDPLNLGAQAVTSENSAATTARKVQLVADKVGKLIVLPYANPENLTSGVTAAMTGTTSTSLLAAPAGSLRNYLTHLMCTNSHATVGTFVIVQDGSGGTTIYEGYAAAVGGGFSMTLPVPLKQPTTATALFVQDVTTGANVICAGSGYQGL